MKKITLLMATVVGVFATPYLWAQMNHGGMAGMNHGTQLNAAKMPEEASPALPKQVQAVFDSYIKIQTALAEDSMKEVNANATAIIVTVQALNVNTLPAEVAQQAKMLAKANDLKAARDAFKSLSGTLIKYLDANKPYAGHFVKVYCQMADARWLQAGSDVNNPYLGKDMARCGKIES